MAPAVVRRFEDGAEPHSLEAERSVLGAILVENACLDGVRALLHPADFFRDAHRRIYHQQLSLADRQAPIDLITLTEALAVAGDLDEVGGPAYVASLVDGVPLSTNVAHYAAIVADKARRRQIARALRRAHADLYDGADSGEVLGRLTATLAPPARGVSGFRFQLAGEILSEPHRSYLVEGHKIADGLNVIFGPQGTCKSQLAVLYGLAQMTGRPVAGLVATQAGGLCYHDLEWVLRPRLEAAAVHYGIDATELPIVRPHGQVINLADPASVRDYVAALREHDIRPLEHVFDTTSRAADYDENKEGSKIVRAADYIREYVGGAVTLITHPGVHNPNRPRGGNQIEAAADMVLHVQRTDAGLITVTGRKVRFGPADAVLATFRMVEVPAVPWGVTLLPTHEVVSEPGTSALSARDRATLDALPLGGARFMEWRNLAKARSVSDSQFSRAVRHLSDSGHVLKSNEVYRHV